MSGFENLPTEIVRRLLERGHEVAMKAAVQATEFSTSRENIRSCLLEYITKIPDEVFDSEPPVSVCAVDGGLVCDSKSIGDICTAVAVSVGPGDEDGDCDIWMDSVSRSPQNKDVLSGIMSSMEILLAAKSKADVVMLDGAMLSTLINVSKAILTTKKAEGPLAERAQAIRTDGFREAVMHILTCPRFIAMPKYTTTNEFTGYLPSAFKNYDARTIATIALKPGEMTHYSRRETDERNDAKRQLIGPSLGFSKDELDKFSSSVGGVISCYYRPHAWTPAFRIDMTAEALNDDDAQLRALKSVRDTTLTAGILEPFPRYLVDLFAKQVSVGATPVIEMASMASIQDSDAKLLLAMGYRT